MSGNAVSQEIKSPLLDLARQETSRYGIQVREIPQKNMRDGAEGAT